MYSGFFPGGVGVPHPAKILPIPSPIRQLSSFLDQGLSPPAEVRPRKVEKLNEYIFVSNLTISKLKSTLKKLYFMFKIAKNGLILQLSGQFCLQSDFFCKSPPPIRLRPRWGPKILSPPHQKFREKTLCIYSITFIW